MAAPGNMESRTVSEHCDVLIIGAGIAGSSVAYELAARRDVILLEREVQPGYHSTGRSAAMLTTTYGAPAVRALARNSYGFLAAPPPDFTATPLLSPRGMLHLACADQEAALEAADAMEVRRLDRAAVCDLVPLLDPAYVAGGLLEPDAMAIDVAALHQGYLRGVRRHGRVLTEAEVTGIARTADGWRIESTAGAWTAAVLVDAAGAWADQLAVMAGVTPIGLVAKRRTAILIDPPAGLDPSAWPMVMDLDERFYLKPEAGTLLVSPADETPITPCDVQPEDIDVAYAVARYEEITGRTVARVGHRWAGLRSFVADHLPVVGPDPGAPDFVWLAAQGGAGIMTAPATARIAAAQITRSALPPDLDLDPDCLSAGRLRR
jgi:D-arginine dehydrogenase